MSLDLKRRLNLETVSVLALEQPGFSQEILNQMLRGFGIRHIFGAKDLDDAASVAKRSQFQLMIVDAAFDGNRGVDVVRMLRHADANVNRFAPVIMLVGHSTQSSVHLSRNSGANFVVAKPCSPSVLLERILWVARDKRPYVEIGDYAGPDRRIKDDDSFDADTGRRAGDRSARNDRL